MNKIELNIKGLRAFRQSNEIAELVKDIAEKRKGPDEHIRSFIGFDRAKSIIYPNTEQHKS